MKTKDVYLKTMKFVWLKLALGLASVLFAVVTLAIVLALGSLGNGAGLIIGFFVWLVMIVTASYFVNHYIGYMLKAGHVAMVTTAVTTGTLPENQWAAAKEMVKERFVTANVYFAIDGLINGAINQLQSGLQKIDNLLGNVPGVSIVISFLQMFVRIALGYIDECCLGYTFLHKEQSAFKSAADGVVIYFQNWKKLLKDAALTAVIVMLVSFVAGIIPFAAVFGILALFQLSGAWIYALVIALLFAAAIKNSFIDSFMMVKMMVSYMEVAPSTQITFDLYDKLCKLSSKFKNLFTKSQNESQTQTQTEYQM